MPDFMNPSADLQAGIAAGWAEGQRQIEDMQDEIEHLEALLDEQRARAQRLEAALVLTEDQRDKTLKESETRGRHIQRIESDVRRLEQAMMNMEIARKDAIAERDALRKQLDDLRHDYTDKSYWGNT